jgi:hypothetical protein
MPAASSRLTATWRCCTGTRSPASASAIGKMPPAAAPVASRVANRKPKLGAAAPAKAFTTRSATQIVISRVLPTMSASGPSTGCSSA